MTITYKNGTKMEAALLVRTDNSLRVAPKGADDVLQFTIVNGTWVSEDCEPVQIELEWQRRVRRPEVTEADCTCSQELATRLIRLLLSGEETEETNAGSSGHTLHASYRRMVA